MKWLVHIVLLALGCATLFLFSGTPQTDFTGIILLTGLSLSLGLIAWSCRSDLKTRHILLAGILLRLSVCFTPPLLSDDYFRFMWDGKLVRTGISPFAGTPSELARSHSFSSEQLSWLEEMNSPDYYSVYPPVCQYLWALPHFFSDDTQVWLLFIRAIFLLAEVGSIVLLVKLLAHFKRPAFLSILYAFNPLVILDVTGNLHPEGCMVFFALLSVWLALTLRPTLSAVVFGLAVASKLLPLLALPFVLRKFGWRKTISLSLIAGTTVVLLFVPILTVSELQHIASSLNLYFRTFEFNASVYFIARETGILISGYNRIALLGPLLGIVATLLILYVAHRSYRKGFFQFLQWGWLIYLLFATTVHPWYIIPLVALSAITGKYWAVIWSFTVFFSYASYGDFGPSYLWVTAEYVVLGIAIWVERQGARGKGLEARG